MVSQNFTGASHVINIRPMNSLLSPLEVHGELTGEAPRECPLPWPDHVAHVRMHVRKQLYCLTGNRRPDQAMLI